MYLFCSVFLPKKNCIPVQMMKSNDHFKNGNAANIIVASRIKSEVSTSDKTIALFLRHICIRHRRASACKKAGDETTTLQGLSGRHFALNIETVMSPAILNLQSATTQYNHTKRINSNIE
jgi:hypothetical protein